MFRFISRLPIAGPIFLSLVSTRIEEKYRHLKPLIGKKERVLDIGSGNCLLAARFIESGIDVTAVDIISNSFVPEITPVLYDGAKLPFKNNSFDTALLVTVLHHIPDPTLVLKEAGRVSKKIIIIEEIYNNILTKYITYAVDSVFNLEFFGHPHTNKTDREWKETLKSLGLKLVKTEYSTSLGFLQRALYVVTS